MKTSVVKFFAGSRIWLAVLYVLFLGVAGVCHAQATAAPAQPPPTAKTVAAAVAPAAIAQQIKPAPASRIIVASSPGAWRA